ncbi:MAG TPA: CopD family protein, partial [Candidatus Dormibacteraeota bacterium]|nr:CopD family protein [Candidatus Dormibacteraeota bacterium]
MSLYGFAVVVWRWLEYAGLIGFVGVVVVRRLGAMPPAQRWARPSMQGWLAAAFVGGVGLLAAQTLHGMQPTIAGVVRVVAEGVALGLCLTIGRGAAPAGFLAALMLALGGHAALISPAAGAIFTDAIHVLSAGTWAGGILVLSFLHPPEGWRGEAGRTMLNRFGRVAFLAFAITALTGVLRATEVVSRPSDLWETQYGLVLSAKSTGVVVMVAMSALVWRRGFRYAQAEGVLVLLVLAATA